LSQQGGQAFPILAGVISATPSSSVAYVVGPTGMSQPPNVS
jgi:hypothetical protein